MTSGKILILFTSAFPYGKGETFIETEFPFLQKSFEKIFIVTSNMHSPRTRQLPKDVEVIRIPYGAPIHYKLYAMCCFYNHHLRRELGFVKKLRTVSVNYKVLALLFASYATGMQINNWLEKFVRIHKLNKNNLFLYSYWLDNFTTGLALFKEKNPEVNFFCRAHGWDVYFERHQPAYLPFRSFMLQQANTCFCISENGQKYLSDLIGKSKSENILLSRLGTFNDQLLRSGANSGKIVLVSCSNLIPLKRVHLIIQALASIDNIEIEWVHFGDGKLAKELKQLAKKLLSVKKNIRYEFKGHISNSDMLHYYNVNPVDLFINVSETEGLPVSIMEANSFAIPALATNVGGVSEIVADKQNGILLNVDISPEKIADTIRTYYFLPVEQKSVIRDNAQTTWKEKFNAAKNYSHFIARLQN